jgi:N-acetyl-anhydromuramyl-L-alanine amidase AmpD
MRPIKKIIIHCSDSDDSLDIGKTEIDEWHRQRGFLSESGLSIGYHFVVRRSGLIELGRPISEVGAHVSGHNSNSIGICWVGRKVQTEKQKQELFKLVKSLLVQYKLEVTDVYGHYEFNPDKTCPNLDMNRFRAELLFVRPSGGHASEI